MTSEQATAQTKKAPPKVLGPIRLTTHPGQPGVHPTPLKWGARTSAERGPVVVRPLVACTVQMRSGRSTRGSALRRRRAHDPASATASAVTRVRLPPLVSPRTSLLPRARRPSSGVCRRVRDLSSCCQSCGVDGAGLQNGSHKHGAGRRHPTKRGVV